MPRTSAGILMFRRTPAGPQVLLVHPGGPFWANKDKGAWSIPKGEIEPGEDPLAAARREFREELGIEAGEKVIELGEVRQKGGKIVKAWAVEGNCDVNQCKSNNVRLQWPPKSGRWVEFPEVDAAQFFGFDEAKIKVNPAQVPLLEELETLIRTEESIGR